MLNHIQCAFPLKATEKVQKLYISLNNLHYLLRNTVDVSKAQETVNDLLA